jgi:TfoX/Sxy family transcriptional regulator of competence genes
MATEQSFVDFVCEQLRESPEITTRKMFGEYALYSRGKVIALICDNQVFFKKTIAGQALLPKVIEGVPFPGAKAFFLVDDILDDSDLLTRLVEVTFNELPMPKPKSKSKPNQKAKPKAKKTP